MHKYHFAGYDFYISESLHPVINEEADQFLIVQPDYHEICFSVKLEGNRMRLDSFFSMRHEVVGKSIYIYQKLYETGEEINEEDQSLPL